MTATAGKMWRQNDGRAGGSSRNRAGSASRSLPPIRTLALTHPSEVSSCHPSLLANVVTGLPRYDAEAPKPPSTSSRPCSSVRSSPSGTLVPTKVPESKRYVEPFTLRPVIERGQGLMINCRRALPVIVLMRRAAVFAYFDLRSMALRNWYQATLRWCVRPSP